MYIPRDPPLVLHILTSWQPASQAVTSPHALEEVGLGSDLNWQSPGQKTNVPPLCQRPGFRSSLFDHKILQKLNCTLETLSSCWYWPFKIDSV